jgi:16S rRNA (adenine1518-N6/adenine1519-N6)-dimethyltransferase
MEEAYAYVTHPTEYCEISRKCLGIAARYNQLAALLQARPSRAFVFKHRYPVRAKAQEEYMKRKPKLGQNFLVDDAARHAIAEAVGDVSARTVIEIGPGHGAITSILAGRCRRLVAIEVDPALAAELRFQFRNQPQVEVLEADVLEVDLAGLVPEGESADVIGNLPYYITSQILLKLFVGGAGGSLARAVLMMQREVADRVAAAPGGRDYGLLSATAQMNARVETLFTLPPEAFLPPPEVYSTVLRMEFAPRFRELGVDAAGFDAFLKTCFAQKRKTLANNLRAAGYPPDTLQAEWPAEIPPQARAESVALEPMALLYRALAAPAKP